MLFILNRDKFAFYIVNFILLLRQDKRIINRIIHKVFKVNYWKFVNKTSFKYYNNFYIAYLLID